MEDKYLDVYKDVKKAENEKKNDYLDVYDATKSTSKNVKISKKKMLSFRWDRAAKVALAVAAIGGIYKVSEDAVHRNLGGNYIVSQVEESGILPRGFGSTKLSTGVTFNYIDANGNVQIATDSEAIVEDIFEDGLSAGFTADQMAVYFDYGHGWSDRSEIFEGSTVKGRIEAKNQAYEERVQEENTKGVSR